MRLREWVRQDFGVDLISIEETGHGADENAELWRGVAVDGAAYAVKLSGGGSPAGLVLSVHLAAHSVPGIAWPILTRDDRLWSEREGRRLSVVPWASDDRALTGGMGAEHWTSFGALLAHVHAMSPTEELARLLPHGDHTHERVASTVGTLDDLLNTPADHLAEALVEEWLAASGLVSTLVERADGLGQELRARTAVDVVCHGDPHIGNVLIGEGERVWLIDWDDAVLAPRERDLMFVIGGVLANAPVTSEQQSWFFDGYGPAQLDPTRLAYYRCTRALEDLAYPAVQVMDTNRYTETERAEALSIIRGVLSPTGLAHLALSSVRDLDLASE